MLLILPLSLLFAKQLYLVAKNTFLSQLSHNLVGALEVRTLLSGTDICTWKGNLTNWKVLLKWENFSCKIYIFRRFCWQFSFLLRLQIWGRRVCHWQHYFNPSYCYSKVLFVSAFVFLQTVTVRYKVPVLRVSDTSSCTFSVMYNKDLTEPLFMTQLKN